MLLPWWALHSHVCCSDYGWNNWKKQVKNGYGDQCCDDVSGAVFRVHGPHLIIENSERTVRKSGRICVKNRNGAHHYYDVWRDIFRVQGSHLMKMVKIQKVRKEYVTKQEQCSLWS